MKKMMVLLAVCTVALSVWWIYQKGSYHTKISENEVASVSVWSENVREMLHKDEPAAVFTENKAVASVMQEAVGIGNFPLKPGKVKGVIHGGGPAPGITVPGEFETQIASIGTGIYEVTLTEYWNSTDFHGGNADPDKLMLSHFWKYKATPTQVTLIDNGGDFPPQLVK